MHPRRRARELALQVLFLWDANGGPDSEQAESAIRAAATTDATGMTLEVEPAVRSDALDIARGAWLDREATDKRLELHAPQWPPKRQPGVDRAILRLAVWELNQGGTPPKVVLDEAIELAKVFSTENSPAFVNGVLDAILKENQGLTGAPVTATPPAE
jgi:N utilization substance protein B